MGKRSKWQHIMDLEVQDLKEKIIFSSKDLVWTEIDRKNNSIDRVALIPLKRVPDFIKGEEENPIAPCKFIRKTNKEPKQRATAALRYEIYHCSFGPQDKRGNPPTKRRTSFVQKRGCQSHFIVKVMHEIPDRAILTFNMYEHEDGQGWPCHGQHDTSGDTRTLHKPKLSRDVVSYVESCFFLGVPIDMVYRTHIKRHVDMDAATRDRDFFLCRKYIVNIYNRLAKGNYQPHQKDEMSVNLWYQKHREDFFFYQKPNGVEVPFIIGIQTKWMLDTMVKLSHNSLLAMDSTFNTNKYGYQLYTLVAFDEQQSGVPVAWVVASRNTSDDIALWLEQLMHKCFETHPDWKVNAFMVDDALAEITALRRITGCDVILCVWHVRRAWLKNVNRLATSSIKANEMFSDLGYIMKHTLSNEVEDAISQFFIKFADEEKFLDYFHKNWVAGDKIRMWVKGCREFPHASQETNNAVESYHCYLKTTFLSDRRKKCARRMDWLLHMLLTTVEPCYRFKEILKEEGFLNNYKREKQLESSVERARKIQDIDCCPHESITHAYWVRSQTDQGKKYLVTWYRTDFITCECPWSIRGNLCKHAIKVNWLYFHLDNSNPLLHQHAEDNIFSDPPEINIEPQNHDVNVNATLMATNIDDADAETLHLAREEMFNILHLILDNPPTTLAKTNQLTGMLNKLLDEANNLNIMDFDFTPGSGSLDSSLKRKKSFLSPTKKRKSRAKNNGLEIDLNVDPSEYEPFEFRYLNKRGRPRSNNAMSMVPEMQQSTTMAITQEQREMEDHSTLPAMPGNYRTSGEASSSTMTDHPLKCFNSSGNQ